MEILNSNKFSPSPSASSSVVSISDPAYLQLLELEEFKSQELKRFKEHLKQLEEKQRVEIHNELSATINRDRVSLEKQLLAVKDIVNRLEEREQKLNGVEQQLAIKEQQANFKEQQMAKKELSLQKQDKMIQEFKENSLKSQLVQLPTADLIQKNATLEAELNLVKADLLKMTKSREHFRNAYIEVVKSQQKQEKSDSTAEKAAIISPKANAAPSKPPQDHRSPPKPKTPEFKELGDMLNRLESQRNELLNENIYEEEDIVILSLNQQILEVKEKIRQFVY
jgi:hypothetical protein